MLFCLLPAIVCHGTLVSLWSYPEWDAWTPMWTLQSYSSESLSAARGHTIISNESLRCWFSQEWISHVWNKNCRVNINFEDLLGSHSRLVAHPSTFLRAVEWVLLLAWEQVVISLGSTTVAFVLETFALGRWIPQNNCRRTFWMFFLKFYFECS